MDYAGFDCKITVPLQSPIRRRRWRIVGKRRRNLKRSLEKAKQKKEPRLVAIPNQSQLFYTLTITPNRVRSVVWG